MSPSALFQSKHAWTTLSVVIIFILVFFISAIVASVLITSESTSVTEEEMQQLVDDTLKDLTSYMTISEVVGRFDGSSDPGINKIAFLLKPMFTQPIDVDSMTLKMNVEDDMLLYQFDGSVDSLGPSGLFSHDIWNNLSEGSFGIITVYDKDSSVTSYQVFNDRSDMAYLIISLSDSHRLKSQEEIEVRFLHTSGLHKSLNLHVPLPMKQVVTLAQGFL